MRVRRKMPHEIAACVQAVIAPMRIRPGWLQTLKLFAIFLLLLVEVEPSPTRN